MIGWSGLYGCDGGRPGPDGGGHSASAVEVSVSCAGTDNPLRFSCTASVDPPGPVALRASRTDGSGERVVTRPESAATHTATLTFLAADTDYRVVAASGGGEAVTTFHTGSAPTSVASSLAVSGTASAPYVGVNVPCTKNVAVAAAYDTATGELVWYQELQSTGSLSGFNTVSFTEDHTVVGLTGSAVVEVDLEGGVLLRRPYDRYYNHDLFRRDGLTWLIWSDTVDRLTLQGLAVWDRDGTELDVFSMREWELPASAAADWSHANSVWVDADHQAWVSLYTQNTIVKLDGEPGSASFGTPEWVLAGSEDGGGLGQDFVVDWSGVDGEDAFHRQHAASITPDGRLQLLDNANGRSLVLSVDERSRRAVVDESWATDLVPCGPQGTATTTGAGHRLVGCNGRFVREYDGVSATPVWTAEHACLIPPVDVVIGINRWYPLEGW